MAEELVYQIRALSTKHGDLQQKAAGLETENTALSNLLDRANFTAPRFALVLPT